MIIGNGLIARSLSGFEKDNNVVIFASGVSNSSEANENEYEREKKLLLEQRNKNKHLVYFSTCSIFDSSLSESRYIIHKKEIENLLLNDFENYLLIRLPILIGRTSNRHTFFNFIRDRIINNEFFQIHKNAWRYLLDTDDLTSFFPKLLREYYSGKHELNMVFNNEMNVADIIKLYEKILGIEANAEFVNKGCKYTIDNNAFKFLLKKNGIKKNMENYNYSVLKKYLLK